ncbi:MAG: response regulator [Lachnospiraceae bacterium]|nr:response regulator [Lachnospiraceae bacterium]
MGRPHFFLVKHSIVIFKYACEIKEAVINDCYRQYSPASDPTDIYFLDIQLGDMLGLDIAKDLRSHGYQGVIIFLTVFREYVFHGYEVHAMNYLLKPVKEESLYLCLDEVARNLE